ncbi:hypothetical protein [Actinoplanes derwentensis]|uniref:Uncharacterized protein n=1 Tax=Actinoplanes derwentensis TaxID=113562 RepID=A0A1H2DCZ7_9ACTN|nr:hypothetical protein [Actinoplanes derwentensis]GID90415.1 hypothetical protein Ade03nite_93390 [Actinoplanes derwentensis]SDT80454.1 hypothetical protein SAMN04489716_9210 [Actinoplanes derwentensis]
MLRETVAAKEMGEADVAFEAMHRLRECRTRPIRCGLVDDLTSVQGPVKKAADLHAMRPATGDVQSGRLR